jgi:hypothetical protein
VDECKPLVVGTTEVGWDSAKPGHRDDHHAALHEVGLCRLNLSNSR